MQDGLAAKVAAGVLLGAYESTRYRKDPPVSKLRSAEVLGVGSSAGLSEAVQLAKGTLLARYVPHLSPQQGPIGIALQAS